MKKFAKMSLVAAVAVAGLTSYATAGSLEEAVKNTDLSGYLRYRIETDHETDGTDTVARAKYVVKTKTKVNDYITASTKLVGETYQTDIGVDVDQLFFTYANMGATVSVGRQGLVSPMTDNGNDGDGIVATYAAGPVTLAGAYYLSVGNAGFTGVDIYGIGAMGSVSMVNFAGWYLSTADATWGTSYNQRDAYSLQADAKFGPVGAYVFYSEADEDQNDDEIEFLKAGINGSFGIVSAQLNYVKTGEQSGDTTFDGDVDAEANLGLLTNDMMLINDADAWHVGVSAKATDKITVAAHHLVVDGDTNSNAADDAKETELNAKYQMSKNFHVLGRYSFGDVNDADFKNSRIELLYTF